jgi:hypothetical protein
VGEQSLDLGTGPRSNQETFWARFSRWHVWVILTSYLGWTARRPVQQTKKRDEAAIERWKGNDLHRIVLDSEERGDHLVFIDETGFMMTPTIRRTFAAPGVTPINKVSDPHGRISVIAGVSISPKRKQLGWHYHLLNDNMNFRGASVVEFLESLAGKYEIRRFRAEAHGSLPCLRHYPAWVRCLRIFSNGSPGRSPRR